jgi:peptide/nickel transport system permease protein
VILTYALKNALIPVITVASIQVGSMLVGAVLVESVFAMGGLGDLLITAIKAADYPIVQGVTLLMVFIFLVINLVVDILYAVLDPRIRMK